MFSLNLQYLQNLIQNSIRRSDPIIIFGDVKTRLMVRCITGSVKPNFCRLSSFVIFEAAE